MPHTCRVSQGSPPGLLQSAAHDSSVSRCVNGRIHCHRKTVQNPLIVLDHLKSSTTCLDVMCVGLQDRRRFVRSGLNCSYRASALNQYTASERGGRAAHAHKGYSSTYTTVKRHIHIRYADSGSGVECLVADCPTHRSSWHACDDSRDRSPCVPKVVHQMAIECIINGLRV